MPEKSYGGWKIEKEILCYIKEANLAGILEANKGLETSTGHRKVNLKRWLSYPTGNVFSLKKKTYTGSVEQWALSKLTVKADSQTDKNRIEFTAFHDCNRVKLRLNEWQISDAKIYRYGP